MTTLGIDIGGSGIKGAPVDVSAGTLAEERYRVVTPHPASVKKVVAAVAEVVAHFGAAREPNIKHSGAAREPNIKHSSKTTASGDPVGITFPGVVVGGVTRTAANVDPSWRTPPAWRR
jgi:polyphosphate glucokinase